jgi:hypothetical protein
LVLLIFIILALSSTQFLTPPFLAVRPPRPTIALCYTSTEDYFYHTAVSVNTFLNVTKPSEFFDTRLHIVIIQRLPGMPHETEWPEQPVNETVEFFRQRTFLPIYLHLGVDTAPFEVSKMWRKATGKDKQQLLNVGARLFLYRMLRDDYIYYVDCDTFWGKDFQPFLRNVFDFHPDHMIYAAQDSGVPEYYRERISKLGLNPDRYFNGGMFVVRNVGLEARIVEGLRWFDAQSGANWFDQDTLNHAFPADDRYELSREQWNYFGNWEMPADIHSRIMWHTHWSPFIEEYARFNREWKTWQERS